MGFLVKAHVESEVRFTEFNELVAVSVNKALVEWAAIALQEIRARAPVGDDPRGPGPHFRKPNDAGDTHLRDSFRYATRPRPTFGGAGFLDLVVFSDDPVAVWQELGTRGRRRRNLKAGGFNPTEGNRGVKALYFMRRGLQAATPAGVALVQAALDRVGVFGGGSALVDTGGKLSSPPSLGARKGGFRF